MHALRLSTLCLSLALAAWVPAHAAPGLESYALTAGGASAAPPGAPPFACATFGPDPRAANFLGGFQVGLPTDSGCGVGIDSRLATATSGSVQVAATLAVGFGQPGDIRSFVGSAAGRAGYGDLGASAAASYNGNTDSATVSGAQAFGRQIETMTFAGAAGGGIFRPTFTVDGSLFNVGRTDSQLAFFYSVGNGPNFLAFRIQNSRGTISFYKPGGYVATLPGMTVTGDLANGLNVAGSTTFFIDIPMVFGTAFDVSYGLWAASLPSSSAGLLTASAGDVSFISSARMTGIDVFTAAGQPVSNFTVSAGSGTLYGAGGVLPQVPEPATWLLMGLGVAVLVAHRPRRTAAT